MLRSGKTYKENASKRAWLTREAEDGELRSRGALVSRLLDELAPHPECVGPVDHSQGAAER